MSQTKRAYDKFLLYGLLIIALGVVGFISATTIIDPNYLNTTGPVVADTGIFTSVDSTEYYLNSVNVTGGFYSGQGVTATVGFNQGLDYLPNYWYCDGTADDVELNAALAYVRTLGAGTVYAESGVYDITSSILIGSYQQLIGDGNYATRFEAAAGLNAPVIATVTTTSLYGYIRLQDFEVDGNSATQASGNAISLRCWRSELYNLYVKDAKEIGIFIQGIAGSFGIENRVVACKVLECGSYGIAFGNYAPDSHIIDCMIGRCVGGINVEAMTENIRGNHLYDIQGHGILARNAGQSIISNNFLEGIYDHGIYVLDSGNQSRTIIISNNIIRDPSKRTTNTYAHIRVAGTIVYEVNDVNIIDNIMYHSGGATQADYAVESVYADKLIIDSNNWEDAYVTGALSLSGTDNEISGTNIGYVTEKLGTATILSGTTNITIAHGLSYTPTTANTEWTVSYLENPTNDCGSWYITGLNATHAVVHVFRDPGASHLDIAWSARRTP